jgi:hypothetical protein
MINQQLLDYIKQRSQQNVPREQIKNSLVANGWEASDIEEGFDTIGFQSSVTPTPPTFNLQLTTKVKRSYNPFKMWGSWVGFGIGVVGTLAYVTNSYTYMLFTNFMPGRILLNMLEKLGSSLQLANPFIWIFMWPIFPVVLLTPIVMFFYGWGIHSMFRKLKTVNFTL